MNGNASRQAGFSLIEMLTVVAIVGAISLVTVPNFIGFYRAQKMKTSMRQLTTELREARGRAISSGRQTMISMQPSGRGYYISEYNTTVPPCAAGSAPCWVKKIPDVGNLVLEDTVYFDATTFPDQNSDTWNDVVFNANGTVGNLPLAGGTLVIKTDQDVPKKTYTLTLTAAGQIKAN